MDKKYTKDNVIKSVITSEFWDMPDETKRHIIKKFFEQYPYNKYSLPIEHNGELKKYYFQKYKDGTGILSYDESNQFVGLNHRGIDRCLKRFTKRIPLKKDIDEEKIKRLKLIKAGIVEKIINIYDEPNNEDLINECMNEIKVINRKIEALGPAYVDYNRTIYYAYHKYKKEEILRFHNIEARNIFGYEKSELFEGQIYKFQDDLRPDEELKSDEVLVDLGEIYDIDYDNLVWQKEPDVTLYEYLIGNNLYLDLALKVYEAIYGIDIDKTEYRIDLRSFYK